MFVNFVNVFLEDFESVCFFFNLIFLVKIELEVIKLNLELIELIRGLR